MPDYTNMNILTNDEFIEDQNYETMDELLQTRKEVNELDIFDFDNIPMSELDKAYIDYEPLYDTVDLFSVDED